MLVAVDPLLLHHSTLVMTETLAAFFVAAIVFTTAPSNLATSPACHNYPASRTALTGLLLGLLALTRPAFLVLAAAYCLWLLLLAGTARQRASRAAVCFLVACVVVSPWVVRNWLHWGQLIPGTTHGGYTLFLGNNASFYAYLNEAAWGEVWRPDQASQSAAISTNRASTDRSFIAQQEQLGQRAKQDETLADRQAYRLATEAIFQQPGDFAYACLIRWGRFWQLMPHQTSENESGFRVCLRYAIGAGYAVFFVLMIVGTVQLRRQLLSPPWAVILLMTGCLLFVHAFYWTNMRMRAPLQPALALLAVYGWSQISRRFRGRIVATLG